MHSYGNDTVFGLYDTIAKKNQFYFDANINYFGVMGNLQAENDVLSKSGKYSMNEIANPFISIYSGYYNGDVNAFTAIPQSELVFGTGSKTGIYEFILVGDGRIKSDGRFAAYGIGISLADAAIYMGRSRVIIITDEMIRNTTRIYAYNMHNEVVTCDRVAIRCYRIAAYCE